MVIKNSKLLVLFSIDEPSIGFLLSQEPLRGLLFHFVYVCIENSWLLSWNLTVKSGPAEHIPFGHEF